MICQHIPPLIIHHIDEFVPGEAACLCLIDVEIHGNRRELNHATFPAIDRRVIVIPQRLTRRMTLELSLSCQAQQSSASSSR